MKKDFLKKSINLGLMLSIILSLSCMSFATPADTSLPSEAFLLDSAKPVLDAYKNHYDIKDTQITDVTETDKADGGRYIEYYVEVSAVLKYDSATELPQIQGLAKSINIDSKSLTTEEFVTLLNSDNVVNKIATNSRISSAVNEMDIATLDSLIANTTLSNGNTASSTQLAALATADIVSNDISNFVNNIEDTYIGQVSEFNLGFRIELDHAGQLTNTEYAIFDGYTDDISVVIPKSENAMVQDGAQQYAEYIDSAVQMVSEVNANNVTVQATAPFKYSRLDARDYANTYTSNAASRTCPTHKNSIRQDTSKYNSDYTWYCCNDCANYVSQAMAYGGVPTDSTWKPGNTAWTSCSAMKKYFVTTKNWWSSSDFAKCSAGGVVMLFGRSGSPYHVVMIVQNDTVTRTYSAHTNDRLKLAYSSNSSFGASSVEYYDFDRVSPA